ncbi:MAG TPA: SAM-dependent methyltransferase [Steroidobacteraceae bacterium]|nr:SAM-dependent methyltransferase [Steroidobacteraceae bacterium]
MTASGPRSILPPLSDAQAEHSRAVRALIGAELDARGGWLSFERFMDLALYAPTLGYYSAGSTKLGAAGDFITAPEISTLFSRCLAAQCAEILAATGGEILELGAGSGRMARDILRTLEELKVLPERYAILEVSAELAERQREKLANLPDSLRKRVVWLERLPERPMTGVMLANEVADALPCRRFLWQWGAALELGVVRGAAEVGEPDTFRAEARAADPDFAQLCTTLTAELPEPLPDGYESEVCPRLDAWIATLGETLGRGALLLTDYGLPRRHYYHPQRDRGTLRCHFRHLAHDDPYINIGVQDISAWVDFTRAAEAALDAGLAVQGFTTQAAFLLSTGLASAVSEGADEKKRVRLAGEARRLLMPSEMGESFKVMALTRGLAEPLRGFAVLDLRHLL